MASNVISQPSSVVAELNAIAKIHKYKGLHGGHHFILMAMEVHGTPKCDMDCFIKECARLFHNRRLGGHLSLSFNIQFFRQCVNITFQHALTFATKRKIVLAGDVCSRPPIIIRFHDLHVSDIRGAMGEIASYHKRFFIFFGFLRVVCLLAFLWPSLLLTNRRFTQVQT
jgi:hypothetical protein